MYDCAHNRRQETRTAGHDSKGIKSKPQNEVSIGNVITMEKNNLMDAVGGRTGA
jgi:hypothetical protein